VAQECSRETPGFIDKASENSVLTVRINHYLGRNIYFLGYGHG
jgi:hypothetical protein